MSWLYGNQSKYDKNGDGFLNGTEWTEWYYGTYGFDIELAERRRISEQLGAWERSANKLFVQLLAGYDGYIAGVKSLLSPWNNDTQTLAERVFISWLVRGLVLGNSYNTKWVTTGGGQVAANKAWTPYKRIVAVFLKERPICTVKDIENAVKTKQIPYNAESHMTADSYGLFWEKIIPTLTEYREGCLGSFYAERAPEYPEYEAINKIVRGLFRCVGIFSGKSGVEADELSQNYLEIFISHWLQGKGLRGKLYTNDEIYDKVEELRASLGEKSEESYSGIDSMSVDELKKLREELEPYFDDALDLVPDDDEPRADEYNAACDELVFILDAIEYRLVDLEVQIYD